MSITIFICFWSSTKCSYQTTTIFSGLKRSFCVLSVICRFKLCSSERYSSPFIPQEYFKLKSGATSARNVEIQKKLWCFNLFRNFTHPKSKRKFKFLNINILISQMTKQIWYIWRRILKIDIDFRVGRQSQKITEIERP